MQAKSQSTILNIFTKGCNGYEATMDRCHWERRKMGSGVCDHHPNLGLKCLPFHHRENRAAYGHWRGLRYIYFYSVNIFILALSNFNVKRNENNDIIPFSLI